METPLEKAMRKAQMKTCVTCESRVEINGASYCKEDGKLLHPMLLVPPYTECPMKKGEQK